MNDGTVGKRRVIHGQWDSASQIAKMILDCGHKVEVTSSAMPEWFDCPECQKEMAAGPIQTKTFYLTFGQSHVHAYAGRTYDRNCVVVLKAKDYDEARDMAYRAFGRKWSGLYDEQPDMSFYPRGLMEL